MTKFIKGDDFLESGKDSKTFGIHNETPGEEWGNQIEVYGDEELRDLVLELLHGNYVSQKIDTNIIDQLRAQRDEAAFALRAVLAGKPVRNADEIIARSEGEQNVQ